MFNQCWFCSLKRSGNPLQCTEWVPTGNLLQCIEWRYSSGVWTAAYTLGTFLFLTLSIFANSEISFLDEKYDSNVIKWLLTFWGLCKCKSLVMFDSALCFWKETLVWTELRLRISRLYFYLLSLGNISVLCIKQQTKTVITSHF